MDVVKAAEHGADAIMAVSLSTSPHILAFYWNGSTVVPRWVSRDKATLAVRGVEDLSLLHRAIVGVTLEADAQGRMKLSFGFPLHDRDLYLTSLPSNQLAVVFHKEPHGLGQLQEVYVNVKDSDATCFCRVRDLTSGSDYVEQVHVDIGPILKLL